MASAAGSYYNQKISTGKVSAKQVVAEGLIGAAFGALAKTGGSGQNITSKSVNTIKGGSKTVPNKAVVLGEGMGDIKTVAKQLQSEGIDAKWYQAWSKNFPTGRRMTEEELESALSRNQRWIESKIKQGYDIYDIGIDPQWVTRSPFYELEQQMLRKHDYPIIDIRSMRP